MSTCHLCGLVKANDSSPVGFLTLAQQMESLRSDVSHAFIIIDPECIAVFRDPSGRFGVFDSHSRDAQGLPSYGGTAIMSTFSQLSDLIGHLHQLFADRGTFASYEFVPVTFELVQQPAKFAKNTAKISISPTDTFVPPAKKMQF